MSERRDDEREVVAKVIVRREPMPDRQETLYSAKNSLC